MNILSINIAEIDVIHCGFEKKKFKTDVCVHIITRKEQVGDCSNSHYEKTRAVALECAAGQTHSQQLCGIIGKISIDKMTLDF